MFACFIIQTPLMDITLLFVEMMRCCWETEKVTPKEGYRKELDVEWERNVKAKDMGFRVVGDLGGRTDSDMVLISGDMFDRLLKGSNFATKLRRFVETQEGGRGIQGVVGVLGIEEIEEVQD